MITIYRGAALINLRSGIYGYDGVNLKEQKIRINDDGMTRDPFTPTQTTKFYRLIDVTFNCDDVVFENKKNQNNCELNKDRVIDNTTEYFRSLGIAIPDVVNKTERRLLGKRMGAALIKHLLPAIFGNYDTSKDKFAIELEDISVEFNEAVEQIKTEFSTGDFYEQLYIDIKESDIEKIYDNDFRENECEYAVLVCTSCHSPFERYKFIPSIYYYCMEDDKEQYTEPIEDIDDTLTALTSMLVRHTVLELENFVSPYYYKIKYAQNLPHKFMFENTINKTSKSIHEFKLDFNIDIPSADFIPRYFYFMTKIDNDIFKKNFPGCKSPEMRRQVLIEKAKEHIRGQYADEIKQYYQQTLSNIEDICGKFLAIDSEKLLNQEISDINDFKKALSSLCNESDIDEVWHFCEEMGLFAQKTSKYIYSGIEEAMQNFFFKLSDSLSQEVEEKKETSMSTKNGSDSYTTYQLGKQKLLLSMEEYVSKSELRKHTQYLAGLLKRYNIDELCKTRDDCDTYRWNPNAGERLYYRNDIDVWGKDFIFLDIDGNRIDIDTRQNIYYSLKQILENYCKALIEN